MFSSFIVFDFSPNFFYIIFCTSCSLVYVCGLCSKSSHEHISAQLRDFHPLLFSPSLFSAQIPLLLLQLPPLLLPSLPSTFVPYHFTRLPPHSLLSTHSSLPFYHPSSSHRSHCYYCLTRCCMSLYYAIVDLSDHQITSLPERRRSHHLKR